MQSKPTFNPQLYAVKKTEPTAEELSIKRKRKNRLKLLGVLLVFFMLWATGEWKEQQAALEQKQQELAGIKAEVEAVNEVQLDLIYQVKRLQDYDYIAEVARRDYFLSGPGELIFKIGD
jgi:cell division protein DivIC